MMAILKLLKGKSGDGGESKKKKKPKWQFWDATSFLRRYSNRCRVSFPKITFDSQKSTFIYKVMCTLLIIL